MKVSFKNYGNTIRGAVQNTCPSGANYAISYWEVAHVGKKAKVLGSQIGTPFAIGEDSFIMKGSFLNLSIYSMQEGSYPLSVTANVLDGCGQLAKAGMIVDLSAVWVEPEATPEPEAADIVDMPELVEATPQATETAPETPELEAGEDTPPRKKRKPRKKKTAEDYITNA